MLINAVDGVRTPSTLKKKTVDGVRVLINASAMRLVTQCLISNHVEEPKQRLRGRAGKKNACDSSVKRRGGGGGSP